MIIRELKVNFKSFIICIIILIILFSVVFEIYPSIIAAANLEIIKNVIKTLPSDVVKAFNLNFDGIETAFGWLKLEGFDLIVLVIGVYSAILGSNILLKEESEKTIEYLNSLPISRTSIILKKYFAGIIYIFLMTISIAIFNYYGIKNSGEFDKKLYWLLSIAPLFSSIVIYTLCLFLSTFAHKTNKMLGICLGIIFISYIFNSLANLSENIKYLKYFSFFSLADIRNIMENCQINPVMVVLTIGFTAIFLILTIMNYNRKELV